MFDKLGKPARSRIVPATGGQVAYIAAKKTAEGEQEARAHLPFSPFFEQEMVTEARDVRNSRKVETQYLIRNVVLQCGATQPHGQAPRGNMARKLMEGSAEAGGRKEERGASGPVSMFSDRLIER